MENGQECLQGKNWPNFQIAFVSNNNSNMWFSSLSIDFVYLSNQILWHFSLNNCFRYVLVDASIPFLDTLYMVGQPFYSGAYFRRRGCIWRAFCVSICVCKTLKSIISLRYPYHVQRKSLSQNLLPFAWKPI